MSMQQSFTVALTEQNFNQQVLQSPRSWLVEFSSPTCSHCIALAPTIQQVASQLYDQISVGLINGDSNSQLSNFYKIKYYPTLYWFGQNK